MPFNCERGHGRTLFISAYPVSMRFAGRSLRRRPIFAAAAVLTIALGIEANTAAGPRLDGPKTSIAPRLGSIRRVPEHTPHSCAGLGAGSRRGRRGERCAHEPWPFPGLIAGAGAHSDRLRRGVVACPEGRDPRFHLGSL